MQWIWHFASANLHHPKSKTVHANSSVIDLSLHLHRLCSMVPVAKTLREEERSAQQPVDAESRAVLLCAAILPLQSSLHPRARLLRTEDWPPTVSGIHSLRPVFTVCEVYRGKSTASRARFPISARKSHHRRPWCDNELQNAPRMFDLTSTSEVWFWQYDARLHSGINTTWPFRALMRDSCSCPCLPGDDVSKCHNGTTAGDKLFSITGTTKSYFCNMGNLTQWWRVQGHFSTTDRALGHT